MNILSYLRAKFDSEEGATATEYIFLLVFIAIAIIIGAQALGTAINGGFNSAASSVTQGVANN